VWKSGSRTMGDGSWADVDEEALLEECLRHGEDQYKSVGPMHPEEGETATRTVQVTPLIRGGNPRGVAWLDTEFVGKNRKDGDRPSHTNTTPPHRNVSAFAFASHRNTTQQTLYKPFPQPPLSTLLSHSVIHCPVLVSRGPPPPCLVPASSGWPVGPSVA
jgi:hypothetical protein